MDIERFDDHLVLFGIIVVIVIVAFMIKNFI